MLFTKIDDAAVSFYGAFGHYLYNNTANAFFFKEPLIQDEMCQ
jgi:hypothetical protein